MNVVLQFIFSPLSLDPPLVSPPSYQLLPPPLQLNTAMYIMVRKLQSVSVLLVTTTITPNSLASLIFRQLQGT